MAELVKSKKAKFPLGIQRQFLKKVEQRMTIGDIANICACSKRTIRDWRREKFFADYNCVLSLCKKLQMPIPRHLLILDRYWYVKKAAVAGGKAVAKKYGRIGGDPEFRKKKWYEWWEREGKRQWNQYLFKSLSIKIPKVSGELAEFVGIMLGDGGISNYQITVTLHYKDDKEFGVFVVKLIRRLFHIIPGVYLDRRDSVNTITVSRKKLVEFCVKKLGLVIGNKVRQQVTIPDWIMKKKKLEIACVRGLVDTDGSVFDHRYKVNGKWYVYKKLCFSSRSSPLLLSVYRAFKKNGLHPHLSRGTDVRLDSISDMQTYFKIFGSHNPKHWKRYKKKV